MNPVSRRATFVLLAGLACAGCHALPAAGGPTLELQTTQVTYEGWQGFVTVNVMPRSDYPVTIKWSAFLDDPNYPSHERTIDVTAGTQFNLKFDFKPGASGGSVKASADGMLTQWESFFRPSKQF